MKALKIGKIGKTSNTRRQNSKRTAPRATRIGTAENNRRELRSTKNAEKIDKHAQCEQVPIPPLDVHNPIYFEKEISLSTFSQKRNSVRYYQTISNYWLTVRTEYPSQPMQTQLPHAVSSTSAIPSQSHGYHNAEFGWLYMVPHGSPHPPKLFSALSN